MDIIDDNLKGESDYSILLESLNAKTIEETLSASDVDWADSCLSKDVGALDIDWSCMKDSLMDILIAQPDSARQPTDNKILLSRENVRSKGFGIIYDQDEDLIDADDILIGDAESIEVSEDDEGYLAFGNKNGTVRRRRCFDNVFRPKYTEEIGETEHLSFGMANFTTYEVEPLFEDIFKIWDLGFCEEIDDFTQEFSKSFVEVSEEIQLISDDSILLNDSMDVCVDHLIAGVGRFSLKQQT